MTKISGPMVHALMTICASYPGWHESGRYRVRSNTMLALEKQGLETRYSYPGRSLEARATAEGRVVSSRLV